MKPNINSVEVHPQVSNKGHPVDGVLVGAGSLRPKKVKVGVGSPKVWSSLLAMATKYSR